MVFKSIPQRIRNDRTRRKLIAELESALDENQKLLLKKLLDMHKTSYFDYGEEAFTVGAKTAAKLIIELITDD